MGKGEFKDFLRSSPSVNVISFEDTGKDGRDEVICNCKIFLITLFINFHLINASVKFHK